MVSYAGIARIQKRSRRLEKLLDFKIGEEYKFDFYWNVLAVGGGGGVFYGPMMAACAGFPELKFVEGDK